MRLVGALVLSFVLSSAASAQAPAKKAAAPKANPVAASYAAMPLGDRIAVQGDLIWTGDFNGTPNGEFSERAVAAVKAFQARNGTKQTGVLNPQERAALGVAAKAKQEAVGWRMVDDPAAVVRLGLPGKLVPQTGAIPGGTRWASGRSEVSVETFRIAQPGTTLAGVFERNKALPAGRKVTYSVLRPDFFVVAGLQGLKKFYVRGHVRGEEVRGIAILYDQAMEGIMEPVVVAMSGAFVAFPPGLAAPPPPRRKVEYASGVVVSPAGDIVTEREATDGCHTITVAGLGSADRIAADKTSDLALLRVYGAARLTPAAFSPEAPAGADLTIVGIADPQAQGGGDSVGGVRARLAAAANGAPGLEPAPGLGYSGAAAVDPRGRLVGLAQVRTATVAGPAAGGQATLLPSAAVRRFLEANKVAPDAAAAGSDAVKAAIVRVICVRK